MREQQHLNFVEHPMPARRLFTPGQQTMHVASGGLRQRHGFNIRQSVESHIPALRMRREKLHALPGKIFVQRGAQLSGLARTDSHFRQQHQLLALQPQMHRIGAQPATLAEPVKSGGNRRNLRFRLARHAE